LPRDFSRQSLGQMSHIIGQMHDEISFKAEIKGSGTSSVKYAALDACLNACGLLETTSGSGFVYAPVNSTTALYASSSNIYYNLGGTQYTLVGAVGNAKIDIEPSKIAEIEFSFKGLVGTYTEVGMISNININKTSPIVVKDVSFNIMGYAPVVSKLSIDFGNVISDRKDISSPNGLYAFAITDRKPKGSITLEAPSNISTFDFLAKVTGSAEGAVSFTLGNVAGNMIQVNLPYCQFTDYQIQNKGGIVEYTLPLTFNEYDSTPWISMFIS
jgi:hypothetical protein